ncbi:NEAT domain-containing protein [Sporosarcina sp. CAU 1771]
MKKQLMTVFSALLILFTILPALPSEAAELTAAENLELGFKVLKAESNDESTAGDFMESPATISVEDGKTYATLTLTQSAFWQSLQVQTGQPGTFAEAELVSSNEEDNTRIVKFEVQDLTKPLNIKAHIIVTDVPGIGEYDHTYDLRLKFDEIKTPEISGITVPGVIKDGTYTIDYKPLHATKAEVSAGMVRYMKTPAKLTVENGVKVIGLTFTNNEQITEFKVKQGEKFVDATVIDVDEEKNTRTVAFEVADLSKILDTKITVFVAAANHTGNYDVRLSFDVAVFEDIQKSDFKEYIKELTTIGVVKGKTPTTFGPNDKLSRAQFAIMLSRALDLPKVAYKGTFSDVPVSLDWAVQEIEAAAEAGITTGSNGKFRPNEQITREQMATMIIRAIKYKDESVLEDVSNNIVFTDVEKIDDYAKEAVDLAAGLGIISGKGTEGAKFFDPRNDASRGQAAKVIYYMIENLR